MYRRVLIGASRQEEDPGIEEIENWCRRCIHWEMEKPTVCAAFPHGIPLMICLGLDHTTPYMVDGVVMDGGLMFEPKEIPLTNDPSGSIIS